MIYDLVQAVQDDTLILMQWMKGSLNSEEEDQDQRIQVAASRMLAVIGMVFGAVWTLSILVSTITIVVKLFIATTICVVSHDIFMMIQNASQLDFLEQENHSFNLMHLFIGKEELDEEEALEFTKGAFLQPAWMWAYTRRI